MSILDLSLIVINILGIILLLYKVKNNGDLPYFVLVIILLLTMYNSVKICVIFYFKYSDFLTKPLL